MTPFQLFREAPTRIRSSWPLIWKLLLCSAISMAVAVSLTAWQADRYCRARHHHRVAAPPVITSGAWPTQVEMDRRMALGCRGFVSGPDQIVGTADDRTLAP